MPGNHHPFLTLGLSLLLSQKSDATPSLYPHASDQMISPVGTFPLVSTIAPLHLPAPLPKDTASTLAEESAIASRHVPTWIAAGDLLTWATNFMRSAPGNGIFILLEAV